VGNIENACGTAHGVVLANLGAVLHWHVPAAEIDYPRAKLTMQRV
jgi:hypothetical protein